MHVQYSRDIHISSGQLAYHKKCQGMSPQDGLSISATACRLRRSVVNASSRGGQVMGTPTMVTLLLLLLLCSLLLYSSYLFLSLLFNSLEMNIIVHNGHLSAFSYNILLANITSVLQRNFGAASAVPFIKTKPRYTSLLVQSTSKLSLIHI